MRVKVEDLPLRRVEDLFHKAIGEVRAALDHEPSDGHQLRHWEAARHLINMATIEAAFGSQRDLDRQHIAEIRQCLADVYEAAGSSRAFR